MESSFEDEYRAREAITELIHEYCSSVDSGRLDDMAHLFDRGTWFVVPGVPLTGYSEVLAWLQRYVILYEGVPRTRHVTTNLRIDLEQDGRSARARSYVVIYQALVGSAPEILLQGAYEDVFTAHDGRWYFGERHVLVDGAGDTSAHIKA